MHPYFGLCRVVSLGGLLIALLLVFLYTQVPSIKALVDRFSTKYAKVIKVLVILGSCVFLIYPYWLAQYQMDYRDTYYHLNLLRYYPDLCVMSYLGTNQIGSFFYHLLDGNVLYLQWVATAMLQVAIFLPLLTMKKIQKISFSYRHVFLFTLLSAVFLNYSWLIFSHDTCTLLGLSVVFSLFLVYNQKQIWSNLILLAIAAGYFATLRFPNVVIFLFGSGLMVISGFVNKKIAKGFSHTLLFLGVSLFVYFLIAVLQYGSLQDVFVQIRLASKGDEEHKLPSLISGYVIKFQDVLIYAAILLTSYYALKNNESDYKKRLFLVTAALGIFSYCMFFTHVDYDFDNPRLLYNALTLCLCLYLFFYKREYMMTLITLCCFVIPILGSNTGIVKLCGALCLPPLALKFMQEKTNHKYILICLIPLLMYMPMRWFCYTFFDDGIISLNASYSKSEKIAGIRTSAKRVATITMVQDSILEARKKGKEVYCVGVHRHLFTYINDLKDPFWEAEMYLDKPDYAAKVVALANENINSHFFVFRYGTPEEVTLLEKELKAHDVKYTLFILDRRG